ncbi:hypothetical protein [Chitinophaga niabensis]|uniref:Uncharacterized protein n=1 Tax=Chitinophaga niabensis TaxID=536979 RepID=A0A1N6ERF5_9BACT|nr:hypothetical protein [Chitinophaga niabensis]SIN85513.1 hypothetical protein SAMN04488055_1775 [Chitinophaga niabensis]
MKDIHQLFSNSGKSFREMVSIECGYSEATFYRKLSFFKKSKLSNAERAVFLEMAEHLVDEITDCINKHRNR